MSQASTDSLVYSIDSDFLGAEAEADERQRAIDENEIPSMYQDECPIVAQLPENVLPPPFQEDGPWTLPGDPLAFSELRRLNKLDDRIMKSFAEVGDRQHLIGLDTPTRDIEWGKWALDTADALDEEHCTSIRQLYCTTIKKKRIILSALHYNLVVEACMQNGGGVGKFGDEDYAKQYAFQMQELYLSAPFWMDLDQCDKHEEINPFFIHEGSIREPWN